jgi:C_GCAxxG_C_C family probable redox protein
MTNSEKAVSLFRNGYNCAQSVLAAFAPQFGISEADAFKIACPFGAGMGRMQETCGAVTGAFMVIGLKHGKYLAEDKVSKEITYEKVREFSKKFNELNNSLKCRDLIGVDLSTMDGLEIAKEREIFEKLCGKYIQDAVGILEGILQ